MTTNEILSELDLALGKATKAQVVHAYRIADDGGTIQAWQAVDLFPGKPTLHTTMSLTDALLALGCVRTRN